MKVPLRSCPVTRFFVTLYRVALSVKETSGEPEEER